MQPYLPYSSEREGGFVNMYHLIVSNVRITTDKLDIIIPSYEAMLVLSRPDKRPSAYFVKCFLDLYDLSTLVRQNQAKRCFTSWSLRTSNWRYLRFQEVVQLISILSDTMLCAILPIITPQVFYIHNLK
ncbi:hypothetical protein BVRB_2g026410 [Beta vulgaris subsp. vulgaris]|nr:hypothetical protein BVRB_2g026410 [Beta vulgaris subsp. vulgaris]